MKFQKVNKDVKGPVRQKKDHEAQLKALLEQNRAGSPTDSTIYWIHFTHRQLARLYEQTYGSPIGLFLIRRTLRDLGYKYRKARKTLSTGQFADRNLQFEIIFELILLVSLNCPIISIDCKKKEVLGNLYRDGQLLCTGERHVYDHDYPNLAEGKVIPHGIYDLLLNKGYISIGASAETAHFICDNLLWWWTQYGIHHYPDAKRIVILCDAGGGNSYRHHAFKKYLQQLAREIGIEIMVCHYPPYCSKWNPIEHRLFCHVHRAMQGTILTSYEVVQKVIQKTSTSTGLSVVVRLNLKHYPTKIKTTENEVDSDRIMFHQKIPKLNYRILA